MSSTDPTLNTCGCCAGITPLTPVSVENPPGLSAIAWRVGTQARFKESLLAAVSTNPALRTLTARTDDDPSIALLDAWATALDVLTFYQERIANENYLRTATELGSVLQLARAIGYELRPGVSAATLLAFTLESQTIPGALPVATIPAGTKVQSIPGQNQTPQLFETVADLDARAAWNSLAARTLGSSIPYLGQTVLYLQGVSTGLQTGDPLLIIGDERIKTINTTDNNNWDFRRVQAINLTIGPTPGQSYTAITLDRPLGDASANIHPAKKNPRVFALRRRCALFGNNAPDPRAMDKTTAGNLGAGNAGTSSAYWTHFNISYSSTISNSVIYLDSVQPDAVQGSWIVLVAGGYSEVYQIAKVDEAALAHFGLAGKSTELTLYGQNLASVFGYRLRETSVFIQTDELQLAPQPITEPIKANSTKIELAVLLTGDDVPSAGRQLIVTDGTNTDAVTLKGVTTSSDQAATILEFNEKLANTYQPAQVQVLANIVDSNNGETRLQPSPAMLPLPGGTSASAGNLGPPCTEVLGSGDGTQVFQAFTLKQVPLTYTAAATASGGATTLEVRVNNILWTEVPSFYGHGPSEQIYITRRADNGTTTVEFGDGATGARLPTGSENITALYRVGTGSGGNLGAGQLSMLITRPLGVKGVTNPLAATGGADGEQVSQARQNAPLTVLTLDRVVSLQDCADFASAYSGIGKAAAALLWDGQKQIVHLTVASVGGNAIDPTSDTYKFLVAAIDAARHPQLSTVFVQSFKPKTFKIAADVVVNATYDTKSTIANLAIALTNTFSFAARSFGQAVTSSDVFAAALAVPGVTAIDLTKLYFTGKPATRQVRLPARTAWLDTGGNLHPADLLTLDTTAIILNPVTS
jgi:hypothetical protein